MIFRKAIDYLIFKILFKIVLIKIPFGKLNIIFISSKKEVFSSKNLKIKLGLLFLNICGTLKS